MQPQRTIERNNRFFCVTEERRTREISTRFESECTYQDFAAGKTEVLINPAHQECY